MARESDIKIKITKPCGVPSYTLEVGKSYTLPARLANRLVAMKLAEKAPALPDAKPADNKAAQK